ncbi:MAG: hemerythrin family protein [Candidatus Marinimicrobia bacterium]|nr:hemerythrin family protein [Candidatus Neomarinimicrobiota bacterium]
MGIRFEWGDEYSVGNSAINEQHKVLFELGNAIVEANLDEGMYFVDKLYEYARIHFEFEEKHMNSINYPDYYKHVEIHNNLIAQLHDICQTSFINDDEFFVFKKFLYNWIIEHIMYEDKKYADYTKALS